MAGHEKGSHVKKGKRMTAKRARSLAADILKKAEADRLSSTDHDARGCTFQFPEDGVYLVQSGAKESRRISNLGDVPDPFDLARLEQLRAAILKRQPLTKFFAPTTFNPLDDIFAGNPCHTTIEFPTKFLLDILFPLLAREAHEQEVLDATAKALEVAKEKPADPESVEDTVRSQTVVTPSDFLNADESMVQREWPDRPADETVCEPAHDYIPPALLRDPVFLTLVVSGLVLAVWLAIHIAKAVR